LPISDIHAIPAIVNEVYRLQPERMIELGIGFGKYGVLCREVLDAIYGRCRPDQWRRTIHGVEGFDQYRNPCWDAYDAVEVRDFSTASGRPSGWDLVLMVDSLEHLEPAAGGELLEYLVSNNRSVIVSVPRGPMPQGATFGNEFECHRTTFSGSEFAQYGATVLHTGICCAVSIRGNPR